MSAWFKVDSRMSAHPASARVGDAALGYWLRLGCWLAQFPSQEGLIPDYVARYLLHGARGSRIDALVDAGMLRIEEGGFRLYEGMDLCGSGVTDRSWMVETPADSRRRIPAELRAAVYARDGNACLHCGSEEDLTLDHIHPWSKGGADTLDNLQTLCRSCNSAKGARI